MICRHCGFNVPEGSEYCDNCGHKINAAGLMDRLDGLREDDITHAGEQPRKTDVFSNRVQDVPGATGKKVRKTTVKKNKTKSSGKSGKVFKVVKTLLPFILFILAYFLSLKFEGL